jgi:hypothetical protein
MSVKRHATPTAAQLTARTYRKVIALEGAVRTIASAQAMLSERMESFRVLAEHCARLLREKEAIAHRLDAIGAQSMDTPVLRDNLTVPRRISTTLIKDGQPTHPPRHPCAFARLHRPGIRCAVCGRIGENGHDSP